MVSPQNDKKRIAKNTLFLYIRMMVNMLISLYTSRVILNALGVDDYGIYQTVGGVVALLSFLNSALGTGSSRFLTYEMGTGNKEKLERTFSTVLTVHFALALLIVLLAETFGLWFVYNKLVIAPERMDAAVFAYHFSIIAAFFAITQVPYNASIIAHEKMSVYAYASIVEVILQLAIVYLLYISQFDKLKTYALLYCLIKVGMTIYYRFYCIGKFEETHYKPILDLPIIKNVLSYSGWNLFANTAHALNNHGSTILVNMFFNPSVVASRAIANQVNLAANQFVNNFRIAANPQIVKLYAAGEYENSKSLLLASTKLSFYLMLLLSLPIILVAEPLIKLWLGVVPEYSSVFLQLAIIASLFHVFDSSFYTALYAKGQIKENAMCSPTVLFAIIPISYYLFYLGFSPISLAIAQAAANFVLGFIVKPILLIKIVNYKWSDFTSVFKPCLRVTICSLPIPLFFYYYQDSILEHTVIKFLLTITISILSVTISILAFGLDKQMRQRINNILYSKFKKSN